MLSNQARCLISHSIGEHEFQVPIFVLTHHPPKTRPKQDDRLSFTFLSGDLASAVEQAKVGRAQGSAGGRRR